MYGINKKRGARVYSLAPLRYPRLLQSEASFTFLSIWLNPVEPDSPPFSLHKTDIVAEMINKIIFIEAVIFIDFVC